MVGRGVASILPTSLKLCGLICDMEGRRERTGHSSSPGALLVLGSGDLGAPLVAGVRVSKWRREGVLETAVFLLSGHKAN